MAFPSSSAATPTPSFPPTTLSTSLGPLTPPPTPPKSALPASPTHAQPSESPYHRLKLPRRTSGAPETRANSARAKEELESWVRERGRSTSTDGGSPVLEGEDRTKVIDEAVEWLNERRKNMSLVNLALPTELDNRAKVSFPPRASTMPNGENPFFN